MKVCARCLEIKSYDEFSRYSRTRDGLQAWCRACNLEYGKLRRQGQALVRTVKPKTKTCATCGEEKRLSEYAFRNAPHVRCDSCIDCEAAEFTAKVEQEREARLQSSSAGTDNRNVVQSGNISKGEVMARKATGKTKMCSRCKTRRKVDLFYKDKSTKDGLGTWCKPCERAYAIEYRERKKVKAS